MQSETPLLYPEPGDIFGKIDLSCLTLEEMLALADSSEECVDGLCHGLHFLGKALESFADKDELEFSAESLCQLGQGLKATATLLPGLMALSRRTEHAILTYDLVS